MEKTRPRAFAFVFPVRVPRLRWIQRGSGLRCVYHSRMVSNPRRMCNLSNLAHAAIAGSTGTLKITRHAFAREVLRLLRDTHR